MSKIVILVPGKTILHGEHAVVYGKGAIAISLGLKQTLTADFNVTNKIHLDFSEIGINKEWKLPKNIEIEFEKSEKLIPASEKYVKKASEIFGLIDEPVENHQQGLAVFSYLYCAITQKYGEGKSKPIGLKIESQLPIGAGLGSSAALCVGIATSLLCLYQKINPKIQLNKKGPELELINEWAFQAEKILHGNPSGIDNSICTYGGALFFKNGKIQEQLHDIPELEILLVYSKVPRQTKKLVSNVREKFDKYPTVINPILNAIESISILQWQNLILASTKGFSKEGLQTFYDLVPINQQLLNGLGVGHSKIDLICSTALKYELPAKLTGAGGGGCVIIFLKKDKQNIEELKESLKKEGFDTWLAKLAGVGVQFDLNTEK